MDIEHKYERSRDLPNNLKRRQRIGDTHTLLMEEFKQNVQGYAPIIGLAQTRTLQKLNELQEFIKKDGLAPLRGEEIVGLRQSLDLLFDVDFVLSVGRLSLTAYLERNISEKHKYKTLEAYNASLNTLTRKGLTSLVLKSELNIDNPYFVKFADNLLDNSLSKDLGNRNLSSSVYAYRYLTEIMDYDYEGQPVDDNELMAPSTYVSHKASLQRKAIYSVLNGLYRLNLLHNMNLADIDLDSNNRELIKKIFKNIGSKQVQDLFIDYQPDDKIKQSHFGMYKTDRVELDYDEESNALMLENDILYSNQKKMIDIHDYQDLQLSDYEIVELAESMNFLMRNPPEINTSSVHSNNFSRNMALNKYDISHQESYKYVLDFTKEDFIRRNPDFKRTKKLQRDLEQSGPAIASKRATIYDIDRTELFYGTMHYPPHERSILATISLTGCRPSEIANGVLVQSFEEAGGEYLRFWIRGSKMKDVEQDLSKVAINTPIMKKIKQELAENDVYLRKHDKGVPWREVVVPVPTGVKEVENSPEAAWLHALIRDNFKSARLLENEDRLIELVNEYEQSLLIEGLSEDKFEKKLHDFQIALLKHSKLYQEVLGQEILSHRTQEIKSELAWQIALETYAGIDIQSDEYSNKMLFVTDNYAPHERTLLSGVDDLDFKKSNYVSRLIKRMIVSAYGPKTAASAYTLRHLYSCDIRQKTLTGDLFISYKDKERDGTFSDNFKLKDRDANTALERIEDSLVKRAEASGHRSTKTGHRYGVSNSSRNTRKNAVKYWGTHGKSNNVRLSNSSIRMLKSGISPKIGKYTPK